MFLRLIAVYALLFALTSASAHAAKRVALLIGNQDYQIDSLDLENPHNDVVAIGKALKQVGFEVRIVKDAGLGKLHREINRYTKTLKRAGDNAIGFFYYSGHGALNDNNRFNYIIPTDVDTVDSTDLWDGSVRLKRIVDDLKDKAGNAIHFVVFDACRNELKLAKKGSRSLTQPKGFKPISATVRGMLIAYATAEGEVASDLGDGVGPYAKALANAIVKPGLEAVNMFREVQVSVFNEIGQEPWYTHGALRQVFFAGRSSSPGSQAPPSPAARNWEFVKNTNNPAALRAFARRYKGTVFADMALASADSISKKPVVSRVQRKPSTLLISLDDTDITAGRDCPDCPTMVLVNAGTFEMGSDSGEIGHTPDEGPRHEVNISKPFYVSKNEITSEHYRRCVEDSACSKAKGGSASPKHPVTHVSWDQAQEYAKWLSLKTKKKYRLLSEAEWEFAARAGQTKPFSTGDTILPHQANYNARRAYGRGVAGKFRGSAVKVGSFGANQFGLNDMHGNVAEWVEDCWNNSYAAKSPSLADSGKAWLEGECFRRVIRGGSWGMGPSKVRSAARLRATATSSFSHVGFRVGRDY